MKCTIEQGRRYQARIQVPFFKRAFASEGVIEEQLTSAGFRGVTVRALGGGTYVAEGTWPWGTTTADVDYITALTILA